MVSEVQFSFDALSFLKEALPEQEAPKPTESLVTRKAPTVEPVKAQDENQTMLREFATRLNDRYDLAKISEPPKQPVVRGSMIQEYLDSVEQYSRDEKMRSSVDRALAEAMQPKIGESPSRFSPAPEKQSQPSMDVRSNELLEKPLQEDDSIEIVDAPDAETPMSSPPKVKEEGLMSRPILTDDDMGLPDEPSQVESLKGLYASKGKAYKDSKIKKHSHVKEPIIEGGIRGNSRIGGDASIETQTKVINKIVQMGRNENMSEEDIGFMLAMARIESGFNPDAAAGTTSASGIGQFIDATGKTYGLTDANRWDLEAQVDALIDYTKFNKEKVIADNRDQKDLYKWMYKYHHDGPNSTKSTSKSLGWKIATTKVNPLVNKYVDYVKGLDPLQGPELPEGLSLGSIRPSARPEPNIQVASN